MDSPEQIEEWSAQWLAERRAEVAELTATQVDNMYRRFSRDIAERKVKDTGDDIRMCVILGLLASRMTDIPGESVIPRGFRDILS